MTETVSVKVLLNQANRFMSYRDGDRLLEVLTFESGFPACGHVERLLEIMWQQLTTALPVADWAQQYRRECNRSLSVGDVLVVSEQAWAVELTGWKRVSVRADQVERITRCSLPPGRCGCCR
jgi:hypothetical protein